ncbi:hypothetical protein AVEN_232454-1, partial [Araneus ventricosus]
DPWPPVRSPDRHVEPGLHPGRAVHRLPPLPRRERSRPAGLHHGDLRAPSSLRPRSSLQKKTLLR